MLHVLPQISIWDETPKQKYYNPLTAAIQFKLEAEDESNNRARVERRISKYSPMWNVDNQNVVIERGSCYEQRKPSIVESSSDT